MSPVPGRHVDQQVVEVAPHHVLEEVLHGPVEHQAPPHDRLVLGGEEAHRQDLDHARRRTLVDGPHLGPGRVGLVALGDTWPSMPSIRGTEKPAMSASSRPTMKPRVARAAARLTVTDDLPTPPLPDEMATTLVRPGMSVSGAFSRAFQRARAMRADFCSATSRSSGPERRSRRAGCRPGSRCRAAAGPAAGSRPWSGPAGPSPSPRRSTSAPRYMPEIDDVVAQLGIDDAAHGALDRLGRRKCHE